MKTLKRSECAVLPLVLMGKWFDMIAMGQKKEEYRKYGPYWQSRIWNWEKWATLAKQPMVVEFRLGYSARAPRTAFLLNGNYIVRDAMRFPHPDWGEPQVEHFVLSLGERVQLVESPTEAPRRPQKGLGTAGSHIHPSEACGGLHGAPTGLHGDNLETNGERA